MNGRQPSRRTRRAIAALCCAAGLGTTACGGGGAAKASSHTGSASHSAPETRSGSATPSGSTSSASASGAPRTATRRRRVPGYPRLLAGATSGGAAMRPAMSWRGQTAVRAARRSGVLVLSLNQRLVGLKLHSGTVDAGAAGWRYGPAIAGAERHRLVAAFNGGFRLSTGAGGFASYGHVALPLRAGLGSVVTYADGLTDIGPWRQGVPARGRRVVSVRQNLQLLIDAGHVASSVGCLSCWGVTLGGVVAPARSGLGITAAGNLVWVGGESLTVAALADALRGAGAVRAVELDINPEWVASYLYGHRGGKGLAPVPMVPGQPGVPGQFLTPYSRDFFTVVAR